MICAGLRWSSSSATRSPVSLTKRRYISRGRNQLHTIFQRHFGEFCEVYDEKYAASYGMSRLDSLQEIIIRANSTTIKDLAEQLNVSATTIRRDMEVLEKAGMVTPTVAR